MLFKLYRCNTPPVWAVYFWVSKTAYFLFFLFIFQATNVWWLTDLFLGRFSRMLIVFIGLNVLLKILRLFGNDKFLLYKMFFVVIKTL